MGMQDESREEVSSWLEQESKGPFIPLPLSTALSLALSDLLPPANCFSNFDLLCWERRAVWRERAV